MNGHHIEEFPFPSSHKESLDHRDMGTILVVAGEKDTTGPVLSLPDTTVRDRTPRTTTSDPTRKQLLVVWETVRPRRTSRRVFCRSRLTVSSVPRGRLLITDKECDPDETASNTSLDQAALAVAAPRVSLEGQWWRPGLNGEAVALTDPYVHGRRTTGVGITTTKLRLPNYSPKPQPFRGNTGCVGTDIYQISRTGVPVGSVSSCAEGVWCSICFL